MLKFPPDTLFVTSTSSSNSPTTNIGMFTPNIMCKYVKAFWADCDALAVEWNHALGEPQMWDTASQLDTIHTDYVAQGLRHTSTVQRESISPRSKTAKLVCYQHASRADKAPLNPLATAFGMCTCEYVLVLKPACCVCRRPCTQLCGGCRRLHYCSKRCQMSDRARHKCSVSSRHLSNQNYR